MGPGPRRSFSGRLGREERVEYLFLHFGGDSGAVVPNADFDRLAEIFRGSDQDRFEGLSLRRLALGGRVETVGDQVEQGTGDLLRVQFDGTRIGIKVTLQRDIEPRLFGTRAVIGEIEALIKKCIDVRRPLFAGALARVQQHVLNDGVGALAVLDHLFQIAFQEFADFIQFFSPAGLVECGIFEYFGHLVDEFGRERGEIIDEIQRVLDFVRDAGGELAERGELLGLHKAILGAAKILERFRQFTGALLHLVEQPDILDRDHGLVGKSPQQPHVVIGKSAGVLARDRNHPDRGRVDHERHEQNAAKATEPSEIPWGGRHAFRFGIREVDDLTVANEADSIKGGLRSRERSFDLFVRARIGRRNCRDKDLIVDEPGTRCR